MAADRVPDLLAEIDEKLEKLTPHDEHVKRSRYEHGGGRMFREYGADRELILDVYNEGDREFYFDAERLLRAAAEALRQSRGAQGWKDSRGYTLPDGVSVVRTESGGVQLEGHTPTQDWELELTADGNVSGFHVEAASGKDERLGGAS